MSEPYSLHRFVERKSEALYLAIQRIEENYDGVASNIWADEPSSAEVVYRFLEFKEFGSKLSSMASNILAREFKIKFSDYYSIDISADVHVKRVFSRIGLVPEDPSNNQVIYKARAMYPKFPGLLDYQTFRIGRSICKSRQPLCSECPLEKYCKKNF